MNFGLLISSLLVIILACSGRTVQARLGTRTLTFERTADIVIGLGIVATFLMTFLFLARRIAQL